MNKIVQIFILFSLFITFACNRQPHVHWDDNWQCEVYPAEHRITQDAATGAKVIFVTTDTSRDVNLYFDLNCWFSDLSMMAFYSNRTGRQELFGYLPQTGEIVRLQSPQHTVAGQATLDFKTHDIYIVRENVICQWHCDLQMRGDSLQKSIVKIS